jgi:hypothetical protein
MLRLLRALVTLGICRRIAGDKFEVTPMGAELAASAKDSLRPIALLEERLARMWSSLIDTVRTGKTGAELAGVGDSFELMARQPEAVKIFNEAMVAFTRLIAPAVVAAYDFSGIRKLMDVGGGYGELLGAIVKANPGMRGAIFDLERCADGAKKQLAEAGVSDRADFIAGSFFESVPTGADAVIMKSIIHDWNDDRSVKILANCRNALPSNGKLLLVEGVISSQPGFNLRDRMAALSDLNMMRGPGGGERTEDEFRELLRKGGFRMTRVLPAGMMSVIEAFPA